MPSPPPLKEVLNNATERRRWFAEVDIRSSTAFWGDDLSREVEGPPHFVWSLYADRATFMCARACLSDELELQARFRWVDLLSDVINAGSAETSGFDTALGRPITVVQLVLDEPSLDAASELQSARLTINHLAGPVDSLPWRRLIAHLVESYQGRLPEEQLQHFSLLQSFLGPSP